MDIISNLALASGLSWASGLRLYFTVFVIGLMAKYELIALPASLHVISNPIFIWTAGILCLIEFFADKIPLVDSAWDTIQTFIRIPAGALLAMGAINSTDPLIAGLAALLGGSLTGITHATKAGSRALINTSPEPVSNIATSFGEEGLLISGGWLALAHPVAFLCCLGVLLICMCWMLPRLWKTFKTLLNKIKKGIFTLKV